MTNLGGSTDKATYEISHTWQNGQMATSKYKAASFYSHDFTIDSSGLVTTSRDTNGAATSYSYDSSGRLTQIVPPGVAPTNYTYTNAALSGTGALQTPATVDEKMTSEQPVSGQIERQYQFDSFGRLWREKHLMADGSWSLRESLYDGLSRKASASVFEKLPSSASEFDFIPSHGFTYAYDPFGRPTSATAPDNTTTTFTYAGVMRTTRTVSVGLVGGAANVSTRTLTDAQGRLRSITEAQGRAGEEQTTTYSYDVGSRLSGVSMPAETGMQTRTFTYDNRGLLLSERHPELGSGGYGITAYGTINGTGTVTPSYDARGHAHRRITGTVDGPFDLQFDFDSAERVAAVRDVDPASTDDPKGRRLLKQFVYDDTKGAVNPGCATGLCNGWLAASTRWNYLDDLGTIQVTDFLRYDSSGRLTRRDRAANSTTSGGQPLFDGASFSLTQTYNDLGSVGSITYPCRYDGSTCIDSKPTINYKYTNGFLSSIDNWASSITYQPSGLVAAVVHGSAGAAVTEAWTADPNLMPRPRSIAATDANGAELWSTGDYSYDAAGNITHIGNTSYGYDAFNRLRNTIKSDSTSYSATNFVYDRVGNFLGSGFGFCVTRPDGSRGCGGTTVAPYQIVGTTNHYLGQTYDDAGNVTSDGRRALSYDALGRLNTSAVGGRRFRYLYSADDERLAIVERKTTGNRTTWTVRGFDDHLLRSYIDDETSGTRTWLRKEDEIWRGDVLLGSDGPTGIKHYSLDHLGSPRLLTGSAGQLLGMQTFAAFGSGGTSDGGMLQFTAHERDANNVGDTFADLPDHFRARPYDGGLGRFLSVDPVIAAAAMHSPQLWNRYAYVGNNPINRVDPTGMCGEGAGFVGPTLPCTAEVTLRPPQNASNWTAEQRAAENAKNAARAQLAEDGKLVVNRGQLRPSSSQVAAVNGGAAPAGSQLDHTQELVLNGAPLAKENIAALDATVNMSNGARVKNAIAGLADGTIITKFSYTALSAGNVMMVLIQAGSYNTFMQSQEAAHPGFVSGSDMARWVFTGDTRPSPPPCGMPGGGPC